MQDRLALRRFEPSQGFDFLLCRSQASQNATLVESFIQQARAVAAQVSAELLEGQ
jgi:hypothetical protein